MPVKRCDNLRWKSGEKSFQALNLTLTFIQIKYLHTQNRKQTLDVKLLLVWCQSSSNTSRELSTSYSTFQIVHTIFTWVHFRRRAQPKHDDDHKQMNFTNHGKHAAETVRKISTSLKTLLSSTIENQIPNSKFQIRQIYPQIWQQTMDNGFQKCWNLKITLWCTLHANFMNFHELRKKDAIIKQRAHFVCL